MDFRVSLFRGDNGKFAEVVSPRLPAVGGIIDAPDGEAWEVLRIMPEGDGAYWADVRPFTF